MGKTSAVTPAEGITYAIEKIESVIETCQPTQLHTLKSLQKAARIAKAINQLRQIVNIKMVEADVMALQNTQLGFLTDSATSKNANIRDHGYPVDIVRDSLIEALLRGVSWVGNEFNIIASKCYITKAGFQRLVREFPDLTDLEFTVGVCQMKEGGALVPFEAAWRLNGRTYSLKRIQTGEADNRIPVRVNQYMGVDAIIGKATRKGLAAVYDRLIGSEQGIPEADVGELPAAPERERGQLEVGVLRPSPEENRGHGQEGFSPQSAPQPTVPFEEPAEPKTRKRKPVGKTETQTEPSAASHLTQIARVFDGKPPKPAEPQLLRCPQCKSPTTWDANLSGRECLRCRAKGVPVETENDT